MALAAPSPRDLAPDDVALLGTVLDFCCAEAATSRNFELVQSFLHLFLQIHGESVSHYAELRCSAENLKQQLAKSWSGRAGVDQQLQELRCVMSYFASSF
ncbi:hypothetical protein CYMTET_35797 [Cymbomonas tetramitiformis]|uniref:WDR36/Utp21 C-terminal domain-containing protein n=1 Tax=Cymbomonas tetramitiformis TaxID=36881 RepID=A0AAE0F8G1_9CHLO|nr:hypothetical protein CYMTET_35797 [Cymbomonas tetramitiformis]